MTKSSGGDISLRCSLDQLPALADRYSYARSDQALEDRASVVRSRGYMTLSELRALARWKAARSAWHVDKNAPEYVEEMTGLALSAQTERARIETLTLLDGVGWPMASVVLHFYHPAPYPILDFRALWTLHMEVPSQYYFAFWKTYVNRCRVLSTRSGLDMRALDRALWQYSKENQPRQS